jgi:ATP/maltotriose-dependent transcriptional regulator MalT/DNA-binding SARP family transcriptional activator
LEARKLPGIWYQVDAGDADLATFFHYMAMAAQKAASRKRLRLPVLTPEYLSDLPGFTRRFFRELFTGLPATATLVLDNYQEVVSESAFHSVIKEAVEQLPTGINLIVSSQVEPPPQCARVVANSLIGYIGWEELRLTLVETKAIAGAVQGLDDRSLLLLQNQANGWMAGLVLMLDRFKRTGSVNQVSLSETMESVFNYFAGQIFDHASGEIRDFTMRTAIFPRMTVKMALDISANPQAGKLLDDLYRRRLFTDRRADGEVHYQYHGLFREFLLDRGRRHFPLEQLLDLKRLGAELLAQNGQIEAAAGLLVEAEQWGTLTSLVCNHAPALLAQGRHQTLHGLIASLPSSTVQCTPWLLYWRGISRMALDPWAAKADLECAYSGFQTQSDRAGLFLACSAIMEAYFHAEAEMTPVLSWGNELEQLLHRYGGFPSLEIEAKVLSNLQGLMYAAPHHSLVMDLEQRAENFLRSAANPVERIAVACTFLNLILWRGDFRKARRIIAEINFLLMGKSIPPILLVLWRAMEGNYAWCTASHELAEKKFVQGLHITQQAGMPLLNCMLHGLSAYSALAAGDSRAAEAHLEKLEASNELQRKHAVSQMYFLKAGTALLQGDVPSAFSCASEAMKKHIMLGRPFSIAINHIGLAQILIESDDMEGARRHLDEAIRYARTMNSLLIEHQGLLVRAYSWMKEGKENEALVPLRDGLRIARENDYLVLDPWWRPHVIARLFSLALQSGIEVGYVHSVIRRRNITAATDIEIWPWPNKVYTLGRFEVLCDDKPIYSSGKSQRKPLELLQILCTFGGHAVNQERVSDALWPDADGDAAAQALRTTLHRLRKLLKHEQVVRLEDRQLSLDFRYIWIDCLAFERATQNYDMADPAALERVMLYYRGHFLQGETAPWALANREQLRARYMSMAERRGAVLEQKGDLPGAVECYLRALEVEPVAETFCRRIMRAYERLGRRAEALAIYHRFSHALRTCLGIEPTQETQVLYQALAGR